MTPVVALAWLGCGATPSVEVGATPRSAEGVRATLTAGYRAVEAGDAGRLAPLFTADALVIGLGGSDVWSGAGIEGGLRGALAPVADADRVAIEDSRIVVGLADGDGAAWAFDAPRVTVVHEGTTEVWLPRLTAHLVHRGARWEIDALHLSLPLSDGKRLAPDPVATIGGDRAPGSEPLEAAVRSSLADKAGQIAHLSERPEGVQVSWSVGSLVVGGKAWRDLLSRNLDGAHDPYAFESTVESGLRVQLAPGGRSGWAAAVVTVQRPASPVTGRALPPHPTRVLWTLVDEGGTWRVTSAHTSFAQGEGHQPATEVDLRTWRSALEQAERTMMASRAGSPAPDVSACAAGQVMVEGLDGSHCCWAGQVWHPTAGDCVGAPDCPAGSRRDGERCVVAGSAGAPSTGACADGAAWIPGGSFTLGDRGDAVVVSGFCLDVTEVTVGAYRRFAEPSEEWPCPRQGPADHPVACVSWFEATAYCRSVGKRLPSEEEWEWAARGGPEGWAFPWGDAAPDDSRVCWDRGDARTCAVASHPGGANPQGVHDLAGNVPEWTASRMTGTGPERVHRGGGDTRFAHFLRASLRLPEVPTHRGHVGFRCATSP